MKKIVVFFIVTMLASLLFSTAVYATTLRIGLLRSFSNRASVNISNTHITVGRGFANGGFNAIQELHSANGFTLQAQGGAITVSGGGAVLFTFITGVDGNPQIRPAGGVPVTMGGYSFRGAMEFIPSGGSFTAVNVVNIEEYLYGVLPAEMSPSFHIEALRAQAVASRTFAVHSVGLGRHRRQGFDLCDRYCCQVYHGAGSEYDITTQAVRDTRGLMMFHEGQAILASYFSSSGGATDNSENVWVDALPYLRSVAEIAPEHEPMVWTRTYTWAQLTQAASSAGANIGSVTGLSVTQVASGGRAQELTFIGTNGQFTRTREDIRNVFSPVGGALPSRNFSIAGAMPTSATVYITSGVQTNSGSLSNFQVVTENNAIQTISNAYIYDGITTNRITATTAAATGGTGITINGRGWGHGVGMSQRGAEGMARQGFDFMSILRHYYTGVEIR